MAACSGMALAEAPLPAHDARYEVLRHGKKVGELIVRLEQLDNGIWHYRSDTKATAWWARTLNVSAEESAQFLWEGRQIHMLNYRHAQRAPANNRRFQHEADWEAGLTRVETEKAERSVELSEDLFDPLAMRLQMAVNLADPEQRTAPLRFQLLDRSEVKPQSYSPDGEERLQLPAGCFDTLRLRRDEKPGSNKINLSWHADAFYWMPVRILQRRDGKDRLDIRLISTSLDTGSCKSA